MECSELACEINVTDTPALFNAANNLSAVPGTPIMPDPSRLTSAIPPIAVIPLILSAGAESQVRATDSSSTNRDRHLLRFSAIFDF